MRDSFLLLIGLGVALVPIVVFVLVRVRPLTLLIFHIASRWILDSAHEVTYASIIGPLSIVKIYSIMFTVLLFGYVIVRRWPFPRFLLLILLAVCTPIVFSTILNGGWLSASEELLRWGYLTVFISLVLATAQENSPLTIMKWVSLISLYPLINVGYSFLAGVTFYNAGILRHVGTYFHQAHISYILMAAIPASLYWSMVEKRASLKIIPIGIIVAAHVGLFFASYRTLWIGIFVFWFIVFLAFQKKIKGGQKYLLYVFIPIIVAISISQVWETMVDRLGPAVEVISNPSEYINIDKFKRTKALSGRLDILNASLIKYSKAPLESKLFGLGPGSIRKITNQLLGGTGTYAHNQYLAFWVEYGIVGFIGLAIALWTFFKKIRHTIHYDEDWILRFSFATFCGLLVSAIGTMPFQDMLGLIILGLYAGLALSRNNASIQEFNSLGIPNENEQDYSGARLP